MWHLWATTVNGHYGVFYGCKVVGAQADPGNGGWDKKCLKTINTV